MKDKDKNPRQRRADKPVRDRTMQAQGFGSFSASSVDSEENAVTFSYPSGVRYKVPLDYIISWFGELAKFKGLDRVIRSRRISNGHVVRVYLSSGSRLDVAWDTVLMACEPLFEHYGGLTDQSRALARNWFKLLHSAKIVGSGTRTR